MTDKISKFINSLDKKTRIKLKQRLVELSKNPYSGSDTKKLKGFDDKIFRLRMRKIRIIYKIIDKDILIIDIDYRGNIY
jgi:mRNA-degrading endonuclease RelE of RelBE toxin-antitoxin system